ncbi:RdgB/HAM1 family non-canonical purine NTP pyrophosphatase [Atopobium sp. BV3Ac4]|uniref:RdgB/HAM1 family non-canonical purine NTP pyrophosphatase n=1 Tax=Atopobium sp. BV3Ac4 TaxID=1111121 RepID=UPI0003ADE131|nr:RdgB/HAM1 family non-canonical purine NTP pyrophosphatase [Atopobium sp. BV3Ac4]ERL15145.1 non-canonical purine NTP pyrophosphatase RdgB [Atopobium sp. BV3Ac4]
MAVEASALDPNNTVVVATGNAHKVVEIEAILSEVLPDVRFVVLSELGEFPEPVEDGDSFTANALIKARAALEQTGFSAIADDSGLVVDALDGAPGIYSARYAGEHGNDEANNNKLLGELTFVDDEQRSAHFHSSVVLVKKDGTVLVGEGNCPGTIGYAPKGENGFGYDSLFLPDAMQGLTMAQLTPEQKNSISHRFYALKDLASQL